jgi:transcription elongation factor Elf1
MQTKCPYCGCVEDVIDEYWGQRMACSSCGREYDVAVVHLKRSDFHSGNATIQCPLCGEKNVLPIIATNRNVRCGVCGGKFHTEMRKAINEVNVVKEIPPENGKVHNGHRQLVLDRLESGKLNLSLKHNLKGLITIAVVVCVAAFVFGPTKMLAFVSSILPDALKEKIQQREVDKSYEKVLKWYDTQLEYNGLYESNIHNIPGQKILVFSDGTRIEMNTHGLFYPCNIPKGFAQELIEARMFINDYERSHHFQQTRVKNLMYGGLSKRPSDATR